ncbi:MAG TPA: tetratricopeptide repeat protein [Draconibacterium sp.]|nr:tetratricopeptide repeat protein [Draconibacterium sp.]
MQKEELYRLIENPGLLNVETLHELKELVGQFPFFQTGWMLYLKNLKMVNASEYETVLKSVAVRIPNRKKLYKWLNNEARTPVFTSFKNTRESFHSFQLEDDSESTKSNSLIDKFLSSHATIQTRKNTEEEKFSERQQKEILEKSLTESDEIVTETLAMIYFQQKKYDKALESFRKLSLKYPEKSAYFASRIEEIERLKNI